MNKYEKGGVWTFTLQVELPVSVHSSSSSSSDPVDQAFRTFFLPEIPDSLSSVEIFISQDAANQFASICPADTDSSFRGDIRKTFFGSTAKLAALQWSVGGGLGRAGSKH